ncbi:Sjogren's syndrome/scleroderma autoantigen 1 family protein [Haloglomus litoreum]|uniref:Sjogren's syndrome/scleroderma autoantigen 1 family protein n=1 Tax=Haloglomus litoreum TaxID=3034026 RepID=UPI0023E79A42|nr:Sjogren's syndrome/scleroderma autoantigen 1 family protein [Haloglomus sp. DT116]
MSDFDREAERRKLEEKYGQEEDDRERTQQLSELLLKGATMTDIHCPECGDPIFRHEGRQFCPSCQREVATDESQQATAGQAAAQDPLADEGTEDTVPATDGHSVEVETPEGSDDARPEATDAGTEEPASPSESDQSETGTRPPTEQAPEQPSTTQQPQSGQRGSGTPARMPSSGGQAGTSGNASGLMPARQHLTRTVNRLAEQAAAEEDPGRKREFLAATREAAEALEAVRNAE